MSYPVRFDPGHIRALYAAGVGRHEIARRLGCSVATVSRHVTDQVPDGERCQVKGCGLRLPCPPEAHQTIEDYATARTGDGGGRGPGDTYGHSYGRRGFFFENGGKR